MIVGLSIANNWAVLTSLPNNFYSVLNFKLSKTFNWVQCLGHKPATGWWFPVHSINKLNRFGGGMDSVLVSSVVNRGFESWSDQTKDYKIDMCCFFAKQAEIRRKSKDWLARNQDNVSEWSGMFIRGLVSVS
jgi:hypothetical protein